MSLDDLKNTDLCEILEEISRRVAGTEQATGIQNHQILTRARARHLGICILVEIIILVGKVLAPQAAWEAAKPKSQTD
jgi:hypothetical protein